MTILSLHEVEGVRDLVRLAASSIEPLVLMDGEYECLVVMSPRVLERLLFERVHLERCSLFDWGSVE